MALSITAANVAPDVTGFISVGQFIAGEALTAGQSVYRKAADGKVYKADSNGAGAANAVSIGIAMESVAAGQLVLVGRGRIVIGATVTATGIYTQSETAGGIDVYAGTLTTNDFLTILGWGRSATVIDFVITPTGVQAA